MLDVGGRRSAHAGDHAVAARAVCNRDSGAFEELLDALHFVNRDVGFRDARLRAIAAIFRADAALDITQHADLHAIAETRLAHLARRTQQIAEAVVRTIEDRRRLFSRHGFAGQYALGESVEGEVFELKHSRNPFHRQAESEPVKLRARMRYLTRHWPSH